MERHPVDVHGAPPRQEAALLPLPLRQDVVGEGREVGPQLQRQTDVLLALGGRAEDLVLEGGDQPELGEGFFVVLDKHFLRTYLSKGCRTKEKVKIRSWARNSLSFDSGASLEKGADPRLLHFRNRPS